MYKIRKGSIISENQYFVTLTCEIVSDVKILPRSNRQAFKAKVISVNDEPQSNGKIVDYLVGGAYGASISVLKY